MSMTVRVIKKFYDKDNKLVGYRIAAPNGESADVNKDALKTAVAAGSITIENMTLTSDGRLIGKAGNKPSNNGKASGPIKKVEEVVLEVYTNGRNIPGALIKTTENIGTIPGMPSGHTFDTGLDYKDKVKNGWYSNITNKNKKVTGTFKKKSFKNIKDKVVELVINNGGVPDVNVSTHSDRPKSKEYTIEVCVDNTIVRQAAFMLILDSLYNLNIMPCYIDEYTIVVKSLTGIQDVRKAVKEAFNKSNTKKDKKPASKKPASSKKK